MQQILNLNEMVAGAQGECYITIPDAKGDKYRYNFAQLTKLEAKFDVNKTEISVLGRTNKLHKASGWKGTGTADFRYNTSIIREMMYKFKKDSILYPFEIVVKNSDPQSKSKLNYQQVTLKQCTLDSGILAKLDVESETLDENVSFTFDDFEIDSKFKITDTMNRKKV